MKPILSLFLALFILAGCTKENQLLPPYEAVTFVFRDSKDTIIHWHRVEGEDLARFRAMPRYSVVSWCDNRIQELIIGTDKCKK